MISSFLLGSLVFAQTKAQEPIFSLHLSHEPTNLDPQKQKSSSASYLLGNLYRNLLKYDDQKGLLPDLAESCVQKSSRRIECRLKKDLHWSDGSPLTSQDFLRTYRFILDPANKIFRADLLFAVKNAREIYAGEKKKLGVGAPDDRRLVFELARPDRDFIYNLSSLPLAPRGKDEKTFSGPYLLSRWEKGRKIRLEKNPFYPGGESSRPPVEFYFIAEDSVALRLYEKGELQLLRRLPTLYIPADRHRPDFHWITVTRFDYLGFGPALRSQRDLREALSLSLNYPELQKIFSSSGTPGCAGLPAEWFEEGLPCLSFDENQARQAWSRVAPEDKKRTYSLTYSSLGGEDHQRATEWMQTQWAKLGAKVQPQVRENKIFLSDLKKNPPAIFRKGLAVDRPTCLAALEIFSTESPENYIQLRAPDFEKILRSLREARNPKSQKHFCTLGVRYLMDHHLLIPLGAFDFAMLIRPSFTGWRFNRMNQLDLADLKLQN